LKLLLMLVCYKNSRNHKRILMLKVMPHKRTVMKTDTARARKLDVKHNDKN